jgi:hypothetical protein
MARGTGLEGQKRAAVLTRKALEVTIHLDHFLGVRTQKSNALQKDTFSYLLLHPNRAGDSDGWSSGGKRC